MIPFQPFFLAFANRCRGGFVKITSSAQCARVYLWAVPLSCALVFSAWPEFVKLALYQRAYYFLLLVAANFAGSCLVSWGKYDGNPVNWLMMTVEGLLFVGPGAIIFSIIDRWIALGLGLSGFMMAFCYWLGWKIPSKIKGFEQGQPLGEVFMGFTIGLFIYLALFLTH